MKVLGIQALVAVLFMGLLSGTASAASRDLSSKSIRANAQAQFQSEHPARASALYQNNAN
ncbi:MULTISPECIES: hypothetical protein [Pseudomonas]|uniref:Uncharacterized protein n=2 Tax=Pseudomonas TaxID=286 RepID=A0A178LE26_9PSED|nr:MULTISPECIES: hypothetical protein [Pseudomonas]MDC7828243.1 hypothetical protein [Pseudomonas benzopyrenica]MXS21753.1 hypothetical protein [Pseudomonas oryzihabitans]NRH41717.1 hypothetical protein [Pseudomonas sp. MS15a(2019)]OAN28139.1 hypothetical protein A4V15_03475 [Pseudomonas oryzihabitans]UUW72500.1 hypothetical protein NRG74_03575 [Pseudomonas psychrotolerans]